MSHKIRLAYAFAILFALVSTQSFAAKVDLKLSEFKWKATKVTGEHFGKIFLKSAELKSTNDQIVGGEFEMDINSFTVDDLEGDAAGKLEGHLKSVDFFDVAKFPTAKLVINSISGAMAKGTLTIKGKSNPIEIEFAQTDTVYTGKMTFDRTKFDMIYGSGSFFKGLGDKVIHDTVELTFKVVTEK